MNYIISSTINPQPLAHCRLSTFDTLQITMASIFIQLSLSFLLLLLTSPFLCATYANNHLHFSPKQQAEKLIRSLNLFPKDSINIATHDPSFVAPKILEKSFSLTSLNHSGTSVEDFGHHAGYYSLPHSKAAR